MAAETVGARVLEENGTSVRIEVAGADDRGRADILQRWAADFLAALDKQAGAAVFTPLYARYAAATTFPDLADSHAELGLGKSGTTLHFSRNDAGARLLHSAT